MKDSKKQGKKQDEGHGKKTAGAGGTAGAGNNVVWLNPSADDLMRVLKDEDVRNRQRWAEYRRKLDTVQARQAWSMRRLDPKFLDGPASSHTGFQSIRSWFRRASFTPILWMKRIGVANYSGIDPGVSISRFRRITHTLREKILGARRESD